MQYEYLEGAGRLEVIYNGDIDIYTLGVIQINLQDIIDKVGFYLLSQEGLLDPTWKRPRYLPTKHVTPYPRFIRPDIAEIRRGSLIEVITFSIAMVLADPNVIAVLQNLAANVVWAVGVSGVRGVVSQHRRPPMDINVPPMRRPDPLDIGPNVRDTMIAIAQSRPGERVEMIIREVGFENQEVILRIGEQ